MRILLPALLCVSLLVGCNKGAESTFTTVGHKIGSTGGDREAVKGKDKDREIREDFVNAEAKNAEQPEKEKAKPRKIRYTADLRVLVEDFDKARQQLNDAVAANDGLRETEELASSPGVPRAGTWRIRVPVERLDAFRDAVAKVGAVERNNLSSEDMTAQYYDLEAHLKNRAIERETLRELLKEVGKKEIKHYLEIKRELDAITDDINRKEGQLRLWTNLTDLTTCTVHFHEKQKYNPDEPPNPKEVPTFGERADKTWGKSWDALWISGQGIAIAAIAITPWLPIAAVVVGCIWLLRRLPLRTPPVTIPTAAAPAAEPKP